MSDALSPATPVTSAPQVHWRQRLGSWVESSTVERFVIAVILINAVVLGMETSPALMNAFGGLLIGIDAACLAIFVLEIGLKLVAFGWKFFRNPWNVFDFIVVGIALVPAGAGFEVLRTLRVLRVLRLISALPQLRKVVSALLHAVPGILSTGALLALIFYVASVMATTFFRDTLPEFFGSFGASLFSLFQIATLSSWETIVRPAMDEHPWAWAFFIPFIILAAFTALNLIIAVIVDAMNTLHDMPSATVVTSSDDEHDDAASAESRNGVDSGAGTGAGAGAVDDHHLLYQEIRQLRADVAELSSQLRAADRHN
ncbi:ion transporter [Nesterenkonia haasae]|uniref:ion transporter n=1 Tax=Nesterenkonia haasae TaxID=2587813 RepID=UPI001391FA67|nr:ion transporter [Nesterenkonia haasae]NDK31752.1 ion transporter [Nesterenkonia haasae]